MPLDTDAAWLGVGGGHIPLMTTEDGVMPMFVLRQPTVERLPVACAYYRCRAVAK